MQLVEQLWRWEAKGIYTFRQRLRLLSQCHPIFNFHPQPLFAFIDLLFTIMKSDRQEILASVEIANKGANEIAAISPQLLLADSKDDAAACLSLLIQKCPSVFSQEQVLIPLLQNVSENNS
jgi:hypothetical protein